MSPATLPRDTTFTPVPDPLLGPILSSLDDLAELKCILRGLWHIHRMKGPLRYVTAETLAADPVLNGALDAHAVRRMMTQATSRGLFTRGMVAGTGTRTEAFVLNTEADRRALARAMSAQAPIAGPEPDLDEQIEEKAPRPNIYSLYESNIGMITPLIAEEMKDAEQQYPREWIEEALAIAVKSNRRSWRYVAAILSRWSSEGKDDGKPGRHTKAAGPDRYLQEYVRRRGKLPGA